MFFGCLFPLLALAVTLLKYNESKVAFSRIQEFLLREERESVISQTKVKTPFIKMQSASFSYQNEDSQETKKFSLRDINLNIQTSSLYMIIGSVGSGFFH